MSTEQGYNSCTDCGVDTEALGESAYQLRPSVWEQAYPGYREGIGVGTSRPCVACLELRLGRTLTRDDFTRGSINHPNPRWHSARLIERLITLPSGPSERGCVMPRSQSPIEAKLELQRERNISARASQAAAEAQYALARRITGVALVLFAAAMVWQIYRWQIGTSASLWSAILATVIGLSAAGGMLYLARRQVHLPSSQHREV